MFYYMTFFYRPLIIIIVVHAPGGISALITNSICVSCQEKARKKYENFLVEIFPSVKFLHHIKRSEG